MNRIHVPYLDARTCERIQSDNISAIVVPIENLDVSMAALLTQPVILYGNEHEISVCVRSLKHLDDIMEWDDQCGTLLYDLDARIHQQRWEVNIEGVDNFLDAAGYRGTEETDWNRPALVAIQFKLTHP